MKLLYRPGAHMQLVQLLWASLLVLVGGFAMSGWNTVGSVLSLSHYHMEMYTFPDGGRVLFPHYRLVALYGEPEVPALGALGEQPLMQSIERVRSLAMQYQPYVTERIYPALEVIATVAADSPMSDNSYSYPLNRITLAAWVTAAKNNGMYIVLDLQPGREDFLAQAKRLQPLLELPNVGLALDPEWRLGSDQRPLEQIGHVGIDEVNATASWLSGIVDSRKLPQKLFLLHEFRVDMLPNRDRLDTSHAELAYAVQMDGQGTQEQKLSTWAAVTAYPPADVRFGWKNFYHKDSPMRSPKETLQLTPEPWYVSYQ